MSCDKLWHYPPTLTSSIIKKPSDSPFSSHHNCYSCRTPLPLQSKQTVCCVCVGTLPGENSFSWEDCVAQYSPTKHCFFFMEPLHLNSCFNSCKYSIKLFELLMHVMSWQQVNNLYDREVFDAIIAQQEMWADVVTAFHPRVYLSLSLTRSLCGCLMLPGVDCCSTSLKVALWTCVTVWHIWKEQYGGGLVDQFPVWTHPVPWFNILNRKQTKCFVVQK